MQYMLLIYEATSPDAVQTPEEQQAEMQAYWEFSEDVAKRGLMKAGDALQPPATATSVRVENGQVVTTDGPFAETKEWLGGYYLLDCKDLDEAIECAARIPAAAKGTVEIRPVMELPADYDLQTLTQ